MAARKSSRKNNSESVSDQTTISEETSEMTETYPTDEFPESYDVTHTKDGEPEMTEQSSEEIVEPTADNSGDNEPIEAPKFNLPKNPTELALSDPMMTIIGQRALVVKKSIDDIDSLLLAQAQGDSSAAILTYAESDEASANVKALFAEYAEIDKRLNEIMSQLSSAVKDEKGEVNLTPEQLQEKKDERTTYVKNYKTALQFFEDALRDNPGVGEDVKNFFDTASNAVKGIRGARATSGATGGTTYSPSTSIRPRLGENGYIEIGDKKVGTFTEAVKILRKATGQPISAGQVHTAWANAAGFGGIDNWQKCELGDSTFTIGDGEKATPVTIHFAYKG